MLRMKNFNIFGVHWKVRLLLGGSRKTNIEQYRRGVPKRGGFGLFADLSGGGAWQERGSGVFEGVGIDTPMHTMALRGLLFRLLNSYTRSDCSGIPTHNHLGGKRTLNYLAKVANLAKWLNVRLRAMWLQVWICYCRLTFR